jgi:hypothetical protein
MKDNHNLAYCQTPRPPDLGLDLELQLFFLFDWESQLNFPWLRIQFRKKSRSAEAAKLTGRNDRKAQAAKA